MLSDARSEKNLQDARADHLENKKNRKRAEQVLYFTEEIAKGKEDVKDCLDQDMFNSAQSILARMSEYKDMINLLRTPEVDDIVEELKAQR